MTPDQAISFGSFPSPQHQVQFNLLAQTSLVGMPHFVLARLSRRGVDKNGVDKKEWREPPEIWQSEKGHKGGGT